MASAITRNSGCRSASSLDRDSKDVVEDEEVVGVGAHEKDKHRDLDERGRRGSSDRDRRAAAGHKEDRGRGARSRGEGRDQGGGTSFIDKAKEAQSGEDTQGSEGSRTRREDEPSRRRR
jgi:hypothetical protein